MIGEGRVTVRAEPMTPVAASATGWCPTCLLPSRMTWEVMFEAGAAFSMRSYSLCTGCGVEDWT